MKAFVVAVACAVVMAVGASFVLDRQQKTAYNAFSTEGARVGDPGKNLVTFN